MVHLVGFGGSVGGFGMPAGPRAMYVRNLPAAYRQLVIWSAQHPLGKEKP
jgi:hypothetical protein